MWIFVYIMKRFEKLFIKSGINSSAVIERKMENYHKFEFVAKLVIKLTRYGDDTVEMWEIFPWVI